MARELGLNPKKFRELANHRQEPWKRPLPDFIAALYVKRFGKPIPDVVKTIEEIAAETLAKKRAKKARKTSIQGLKLVGIGALFFIIDRYLATAIWVPHGEPTHRLGGVKTVRTPRFPLR